MPLLNNIFVRIVKNLVIMDSKSDWLCFGHYFLFWYTRT